MGEPDAAVAGGAGTRLPAEKKSIHATERDTDENRLRRISFLAELETIQPECLVYLDESGVSTQMTRTLARARRGQRIHDAVPAGHWKILTLVGALSIRGMLASMTVEAATDGDVFFAFLDHFLCPKLRPGDVLVMDNLSVHKLEGVRQRVEAVGARLLYLPPYSPDLNPIEKAWSKLKTLLRSEKARTPEALHNAIERRLPAITAQDAQAWFRLPFAVQL